MTLQEISQRLRRILPIELVHQVYLLTDPVTCCLQRQLWPLETLLLLRHDGGTREIWIDLWQAVCAKEGWTEGAQALLRRRAWWADNVDVATDFLRLPFNDRMLRLVMQSLCIGGPADEVARDLGARLVVQAYLGDDHGQRTAAIGILEQSVDTRRRIFAYLCRRDLTHDAIALLQTLPPDMRDGRVVCGLLEVAAQQGHMDVVLEVTRLAQVQVSTRRAMDAAAASGHLAMVVWLDAHGHGCTPAAVLGAIRGRHVDVVAWLVKHGKARDRGGLVETALDVGFIDVAVRLLECGVSCSQATVDWATAHGCTPIVAALMQHHRRYAGVEAVERAVYDGHVDVVELLLHSTQGESDRLPPHAIELAIRADNSAMVRLLVAHQVPCTAYAMDAAAELGLYDVVKLLLDDDRDCTVRAMDAAVEQGNLEIVKLLFARRHLHCSAQAAMRAEAAGHRDVVAWLLAHHLTARR